MLWVTLAAELGGDRRGDNAEAARVAVRLCEEEFHSMLARDADERRPIPRRCRRCRRCHRRGERGRGSWRVPPPQQAASQTRQHQKRKGRLVSFPPLLSRTSINETIATRFVF